MTGTTAAGLGCTVPCSPGERAAVTGHLSQLDDRMAALETAARRATLTASFCDVPPCALVLHPDRLEVRVDRPRRTAGARLARSTVQGVGAVVLSARVALAGQGWAVGVDRFPRPDDPELLAVLRPVAGPPEAGLAPLAAVAAGGPFRRRTARSRPPSPALLEQLGRAAEREDSVLVPVASGADHRLVEQLVSEARNNLGLKPDGTTAGPNRGVADTGFFLLLATRGDDELSWLLSGEAMARVLLVLAHHGWSASVVPHVLDVPLVRDRAGAALCWDNYPQVLIEVG